MLLLVLFKSIIHCVMCDLAAETADTQQTLKYALTRSDLDDPPLISCLQRCTRKIRINTIHRRSPKIK